MNIFPAYIGTPPLPQKIYERLFDFMDDVLVSFVVKRRKRDGTIVASEDAITEELTDYLDSKQESLNQDRSTAFRFTNQSMEKTDIGVKLGRGYNEYNRMPFCWIEAKRLPTPLEAIETNGNMFCVPKKNKRKEKI